MKFYMDLDIRCREDQTLEVSMLTTKQKAWYFNFLNTTFSPKSNVIDYGGNLKNSSLKGGFFKLPVVATTISLFFSISINYLYASINGRIILRRRQLFQKLGKCMFNLTVQQVAAPSKNTFPMILLY